MRSLRSPNRKPTHPGAILREDLLPELGISQAELARGLGLSEVAVSEILNEKRSLIGKSAICISNVFGGSHDSWLQMQKAADFWEIQRQE